MKKEIIFSFILIFSLASAFATIDFGVQSVGDPIGLMVNSQKSDRFETYICPNSWSFFKVNIGTFPSQYISENGDQCVLFDSRISGTANPIASTVYSISAYGFDWATGLTSPIKTTIISTETSGEECEGRISCIGLFCRVSATDCSDLYTHHDIKVYNHKGIVIYDNTNYLNFLMETTGYGIISTQFLYNQGCILELRSYNAAGDENLDYAYFETGTCSSDSFSLKLSQDSNSVDVEVIGAEDYSSFAYELQKYNGYEWKTSLTGNDENGRFTITGLTASSQYKIIVQGVNPCETGYFTYSTFTTSSASIIDFNLSYTVSDSVANITASSHNSTAYNWTLYSQGTGTLISTNSTTVPYIAYLLTAGQSYLIQVTATQAGGTVYKQIVVSLPLNATYTLNTTLGASKTFDALINCGLKNGSNTVAYPLGCATWAIYENNSAIGYQFDRCISHTSYNEQFTIGGLTPETAYSVQCWYYDPSDTLIIGNNATFSTLELNTSDYTITFDVTASSSSDYLNGQRNDIDMNVYVYQGLSEAQNVSYRLYDYTSNETTPTLIKSWTSTEDGDVNTLDSYIMLEHLIPSRKYLLETEPNFYGYNYTAINWTIGANQIYSFRCDGDSVSMLFDSNFNVDGNKIYGEFTLSDDANSVSTLWTVSAFEPGSESISNSAILTKIFTDNEVTPAQLIGEAETDYSYVNILVKRTMTCSATGEVYVQSRRYKVNIVPEDPYGALQGGYDLFDSYFPSNTAKFAIIMVIFGSLGMLAFFMTIGRGAVTWAAGLTPLLIGFAVAIIFGFVPSAIWAFIIIGIIALIALGVVKAIGGGG